MPRVTVLCVCQCPGRKRSHAAALGSYYGSVASIRCLGSNGADANAVRTADGADLSTSRPAPVGELHFERLCELSASVEARRTRATAMHWACRAGDVAAALFERNLGPVDARDERGATADAGSEARSLRRVGVSGYDLVQIVT